ncbi:MAG: hypothetical protein LBJ71_00170 [Holosporaceae bacterium]|jgi:hypothetical protein|nr:hypothetical protein [Holosporaceae bacterium]
MKKIMLGMMLVALPFTVQADENEGGDVAAEETHHYEGWYGGFGVHVANPGEKVDYTYTNDDRVQELNHSAPRIGGSFLLGVGKRINGSNAYGSLEFGCDFGPATEKLEADKRSQNANLNIYRSIKYYQVGTKTSGVVPQIALRFGAVNHKHGLLGYVKVGAAYGKSTQTASGYYADGDGRQFGQPDYIGDGRVNQPFSSEVKVSGVRPIIALGTEKSYGRNATLRAELEWKNGGNKTRTWTIDGTNQSDSIKLTQKDTITLRVVVCYHAPLGQLWKEVI